jgi:hypothetical protein
MDDLSLLARCLGGDAGAATGAPAASLAEDPEPLLLVAEAPRAAGGPLEEGFARAGALIARRLVLDGFDAHATRVEPRSAWAGEKRAAALSRVRAAARAATSDKLLPVILGGDTDVALAAAAGVARAGRWSGGGEGAAEAGEGADEDGAEGGEPPAFLCLFIGPPTPPRELVDAVIEARASQQSALPSAEEEGAGGGRAAPAGEGPDTGDGWRCDEEACVRAMPAQPPALV